jgi:hypothetical protein
LGFVAKIAVIPETDFPIVVYTIGAPEETETSLESSVPPISNSAASQIPYMVPWAPPRETQRRRVVIPCPAVGASWLEDNLVRTETCPTKALFDDAATCLIPGTREP